MKRTLGAVSIRAKLMAIVMITTCASLLLVASTLVVFDWLTHKRTLTRELATVGQILGENSTAALVFDNAADARKVLGALATQTDVVSGCLYGMKGDLFASYLRHPDRVSCPAHPQLQTQGFLGDSLVLYQHVFTGKEQVGILRLTASLAPLRRRVQLFGLVLVLAVLGAALAALVLSARLQRVVSRPILELAGTARKISEERDYTLRAPRRTDDEIGVAVQAFNQMLDHIEDGDRALRSLNATLEERVAERTAAAEDRATALKRSNEELEGFASVASHDLQEPLRAVSSYAQLVRQQLAGQLDPDVDLYLGHMISGAARMRELIHDLLDYSRVGRQERTADPVEADDVLDLVLADLAQALAESGGAIERAPLPRVRADRRQLAQLFQNLIINAIRFRSEAPPAIAIDAERDGEQWRFAVRDNGIGIEPRHHDRIFVMFQRLHGRERPGTGIGLAICRKIVDGHRGRIWVESQPGQGSTFFFTLPAADGGSSSS